LPRNDWDSSQSGNRLYPDLYSVIVEAGNISSF
jgi:hypothetical protein